MEKFIRFPLVVIMLLVAGCEPMTPRQTPVIGVKFSINEGEIAVVNEKIALSVQHLNQMQGVAGSCSQAEAISHLRDDWNEFKLSVSNISVGHCDYRTSCSVYVEWIHRYYEPWLIVYSGEVEFDRERPDKVLNRFLSARDDLAIDLNAEPDCEGAATEMDQFILNSDALMEYVWDRSWEYFRNSDLAPDCSEYNENGPRRQSSSCYYYY